MSLRTKVLGLVEVILRVPPLFVIDELLKAGLGSNDITAPDLPGYSKGIPIDLDDNTNYTYIQYDPTFYRFVIISLARLILSCIGKFNFYTFVA